MKTLLQYITEAKESIVIGGITFKEGDRVIYLKDYTDENGDEWEEEIYGTLSEIYPSKKINIEFAPNKHTVISADMLVGLVSKARQTKFSISTKVEDKYRDELDDINYEIDQLMDQMADLNNNMEEDIIDTARSEWLKDNPSKSADDFNPSSADKYMDKAGSEWAEISGLNDLEKELETLKKKQEKTEKKLNDYIAKDGTVKSKGETIKYIDGYEPIE